MEIRDSIWSPDVIFNSRGNKLHKLDSSKIKDPPSVWHSCQVNTYQAKIHNYVILVFLNLYFMNPCTHSSVAFSFSYSKKKHTLNADVWFMAWRGTV